MNTSTATRRPASTPAASHQQLACRKGVAAEAQASREQLARRKWVAANTQASRNAVLARLYVAHAGAVRAHLVRLGLSPADAEDLCAEVFVVALRKLSTYEGASSISTWLLGIARKLASDQRRSARCRSEVLTDTLPEQRLDDGPLHALEERRTALGVHQALAQLKPAQREVLRRFALDEAPMEAVAREQRVPLQTAYARLYAGHAALRGALGGLEG
jgi:RNA polymerase sigma-70 factor (ECF subfamily)